MRRSLCTGFEFGPHGFATRFDVEAPVRDDRIDQVQTDAAGHARGGNPNWRCRAFVVYVDPEPPARHSHGDGGLGPAMPSRIGDQFTDHNKCLIDRAGPAACPQELPSKGASVTTRSRAIWKSDA